MPPLFEAWTVNTFGRAASSGGVHCASILLVAEEKLAAQRSAAFLLILPLALEGALQQTVELVVNILRPG